MVFPGRWRVSRQVLLRAARWLVRASLVQWPAFVGREALGAPKRARRRAGLAGLRERWQVAEQLLPRVARWVMARARARLALWAWPVQRL
jgi:hypothetical protein